MDDMSKNAVKLYRPAVHTDGAACMVDCKIGFWVSKPDYDALAAKLAAAERRERQLLDTTATCRRLLRELNTAKAQLTEADAMIEAQQKDYASNNVRFAEAEHRAKEAEAALPAVYLLGLANAAIEIECNWGHIATPRMREAIRLLPTPTAAELMARIQTGDKE
jgi:hypothetical protein